VLTFISLVVLPPIAEEIMVRGFLYSSLKKAMRILAGRVADECDFLRPRLTGRRQWQPALYAALDTFVLSLVLIYLREKTGSLWASINIARFQKMAWPF